VQLTASNERCWVKLVGVVSDSALNEEKQIEIYGYKGSQTVPVRPTGKGRLKVGKAFVSGEGRNGKWSKERSWAGSLCVRSESRIQVHINLWRGVIGEILLLTWVATLGWNFYLTLGETFSATCNVCTNSEFAPGTRKTMKKAD
jgi:hypothetical protein